MHGVQSPGHAQRLLAAYGPIAQHVRGGASGSPPLHIVKSWPAHSELAQNHGNCGSIKAPLTRGGYAFFPDARLSLQ